MLPADAGPMTGERSSPVAATPGGKGARADRSGSVPWCSGDRVVGNSLLAPGSATRPLLIDHEDTRQSYDTSNLGWERYGRGRLRGLLASAVTEGALCRESKGCCQGERPQSLLKTTGRRFQASAVDGTRLLRVAFVSHHRRRTAGIRVTAAVRRSHSRAELR